ncbi:MAG: deoxyribose-phosphate aldolase [Algoriphagus sp.]|jgi:deoxyribose-phosphate aldolase
MKLNRYLESTLLKPMVTEREIELLIADAIAEQFIGICVPPFWVKKVKRDIGDEDVQVVTVIGFPFGYELTAAKVAEAHAAIEGGADELDVVWSQSAFHSGMSWPKIELAQLAKVAHDSEKILKVIIETAYLSPAQIQEACLICQDAGADFVKTSTGYAPSGAKVEDIRLMRQVLPSTVGIKASGGIKTLDQALALIQAGADRLGTSAAKYLMDDWRSEKT